MSYKRCKLNFKRYKIRRSRLKKFPVGKIKSEKSTFSEKLTEVVRKDFWWKYVPKTVSKIKRKAQSVRQFYHYITIYNIINE